MVIIGLAANTEPH